jgi:cytochrome c biogenesis protein CcmG/thiol:disulfide interchange protein DsbE
MQFFNDASSLRAGTMTEMAGGSLAVEVAGIRRIYYYNCVRRILRFTGAIAPVFILILLALSGCYSGSRPPRIGSAAPDFTVHDADRSVTLSQLKGQVVVLNFWATWCPPCIEEMPSLVQMQQRMKPKGVTVLAVSVDIDQSNYRRFLRDHNVNLLSVRDADQKSNALYGTFKFPETYVIDRNGVVRRKFIGAVDWTEPDVIEYLGKL